MEQHQFGLREWADLCERKDATIAALQARVKELEESRDAWRASQECSEKAYMALVNQIPAEQFDYDPINVALLDGAKEQEIIGRKQIADLQAELERVRGELVEATHNVNVYQSLYTTSCMDRALLENDLRELRTLVLALPEVEGEIVAQGGYVKDRNKVYACFGSDADMAAYAAIVQHRQGMEG